MLEINPIYAPVRKILGRKVHANNIGSGPKTNLISVLCFLLKSIYMLMRKKKKKKSQEFCAVSGRFQLTP